MDEELEVIDTDFIDRTHAEIDEHLDVREGLESLIELVENENVSPATEQAVHIATNIAFAGTGYTADDVGVSTESVGGAANAIKGAVAMIAKMVKRAIKAIVAFSKRVWEAIASNTGRLQFRLNRIRSRAKAMRGRQVRNADGKPLTVTIGQGQTYLRIGGRPISDSRQISTNLGLMQVQLKTVMDTYSPKVEAMGRAFKSAYSDTRNPEQLLIELNKAAMTLPVSEVANKISARSQVDSRWSLDHPVMVGPPILGDKALYCYRFHPGLDDPHTAAKELRAQGITFTTVKASSTTTVGELPTMPIDNILLILDNIEALIRIIQSNDGNGVARQLLDAQKQVDRAAKAAVDQGMERKLYNVLLRYNSTYARWCTTPREALVNHIVLVSGFLLTLCNKSLENYR